MNKEILKYLSKLFGIENNNIDSKTENFMINLCANFEDKIYDEHTKRHDDLMESLNGIFDKLKNATDKEKEELNKQADQVIYEIFSLGYERVFIIAWLVGRNEIAGFDIDKLKNINYEDETEAQALYMKYRKQIFKPTVRYNFLKQEEDRILEETAQTPEREKELLDEHEKIYKEYRSIEYQYYFLAGFLLAKKDKKL